MHIRIMGTAMTLRLNSRERTTPKIRHRHVHGSISY
jgi:hypothetical protein